RVYGTGSSSSRGTTSSWNPRLPQAPSSIPSARNEKKPALPPRTSPPTSPTSQTSQTSQSSSQPKERLYQPGNRVRHTIFGDGIVLKSEMEQQTEFVEVQFQGKHGKKRLSMDFAKLEKL
ncbi:MAG TPA: hypothetical protein VFN35_26140, partial [Ktedonobacteraceae bacterium]|nr:hypothetical protein [Ktedonobacteraceae bacterium]